MNLNISPLFSAKLTEPLLNSLAKLTDQRCARGIRYKLEPVLVLLFLSKLGGADEPAEIADWVSFRFDYLKQLLGLQWKRSPHEATWQRILNGAVQADQMETVMGQYLESLSDEEKHLLNLDGKVLRATIDQETERQLHLLALQESEQNAVYRQTAVEVGENEISAAKRLLAEASVEKRIVSGDAIFAQTGLSRQVVEAGGEYLWKLRANQAVMYEAAVGYFSQVEENGELPRDIDRATSLDKGHGRIEHREILSSYRLANRMEFPYLAQVFQIRRKVEEIKSGKQTEQVIYGITSVVGEEAGAEELLAWTRNHWRIENGLHYRRDVTFKEDQVRRKSFNGGQIMASLNNLIIGLLRKVGWENLAKARRYYNAKIEESLKLITHPLSG